jgi:hypothetical protein
MLVEFVGQLSSSLSSSFQNRYSLKWPAVEQEEVEDIDFDSQVKCFFIVFHFLVVLIIYLYFSLMNHVV